MKKAVNQKRSEKNKMIKINRDNFNKLSALRVLPILKVGSRCLLPVRDFQAWLEKHRVKLDKKTNG